MDSNFSMAFTEKTVLVADLTSSARVSAKEIICSLALVRVPSSRFALFGNVIASISPTCEFIEAFECIKCSADKPRILETKSKDLPSSSGKMWW